jgi:hypothetical protein
VAKARWGTGSVEPLVEGPMNARFLLQMETAQLKAIDENAAAAGLPRNAYVRKALYHFMNCEDGSKKLEAE